MKLKCVLVLSSILMLHACMDGMGGVMTGAQLIYDRHNVFKKLSDFNIGASANRALYRDSVFKTSHFDVEVFNRDLLIAGQTPSKALKQLAIERLKKIPHLRRLYNQIEVASPAAHAQRVHDALITTSVRTQMVADDDIDPNQFKVMTENGVVYLMGDVKREQARLVVNIARHTKGVKRVVRVFRYYTYEETS